MINKIRGKSVRNSILINCFIVLFVLAPFYACSAPASDSFEKNRWQYFFKYNVGEICSYEPNTDGYLEFELAKDEVLNGEVYVKSDASGSVTFYIEDIYGRHLEDAGRLKEGDSFTFSLKSEQTGFKYRLLFEYDLLASPASAVFLSNRLADSTTMEPPVTAKVNAPLNPDLQWETYTNSEYGYTISIPQESRILDPTKLYVWFTKPNSNTRAGVAIFPTLDGSDEWNNLKEYLEERLYELKWERPSLTGFTFIRGVSTSSNGWEFSYYYKIKGGSIWLATEYYIDTPYYLYRVDSHERVARSSTEKSFVSFDSAVLNAISNSFNYYRE